jgi:ABC-type molybdate transport system substrate-binding protein
LPLERFIKSSYSIGSRDERILINIVVYEKVKDHAKWLKGFNADAPNRKGSVGGTILQFDGDPNRHYIVFEFSDEGARDFVRFAKSPTGQKIFKDAGVLEQTIQLCSTTIKVDK